jgi:glutathione S-transferase
MQEALKVIGGHESYFTGKLEAYLRAKGIAYQNIPFTMAALEKAASHTGFFQIPQVECADGSWLVDTSLIIEYLDQQHPEPVTIPTDPAANFIALLLEDYADEWLWRPAMHYRWSFDNGAELLSSWLSEHSPETDVSLAEKKATWRARQKGTFVDGDGVTEENRAAVESSYHHALSTLETLFEKRDFILGDRPTQADFGFMGPMFRHFFCDPDPARLMRDTAPGVQEWVARMWNMKPQRFSSASQIETIPDDLSALLEPVVSVYLPYLLANEAAVLAGQEELGYEAMGTRWLEPAKPYRLWCLDQLREKYQALDESARKMVSASLGDANAMDILTTAPTGHCDHLVGNLPYSPTGERLAFDSWGREPQPA